jgi:hypothetical protein
VRKAAKKWTDQQLRCRTGRHDWDELGEMQEYRRYVDIIQPCIHGCGCKKKWKLARSGKRIGNTTIDYTGAKDYLLAGIGRAVGDARDPMYAEWLRRALARRDAAASVAQSAQSARETEAAQTAG